MASFNKINQFVEDLCLKIHDFRAAQDIVKVLLTNTAPVATNSITGDLVEIADGNGYIEGGIDIQNDQSESSGTLTVTSAADPVFLAAGGTIGPFRYVAMYNSTPSTPLGPLMGWWDYGSNVTLQDGETFTVDFGASVFTIT